jgi:hypothetical protein
MVVNEKEGNVEDVNTEASPLVRDLQYFYCMTHSISGSVKTSGEGFGALDWRKTY